MKNHLLTEIITALFVILFLYTGTSKLMDYSVLKEQIATSGLLAPVAPFIARILPFAEFAVVILLVVPRWRLKGLYAALMLMTVFTIYIILMLLFNATIPCSCGGVLEELSWQQHIVFNCAFMILVLAGIKMERRIRQQHYTELLGITQGY